MTSALGTPSAKKPSSSAAAPGQPAAQAPSQETNAVSSAPASGESNPNILPLVKMGQELAEQAIERARRSSGETASPIADSLGVSNLPGAKDALSLAETALRTWVELATQVMRVVLPLGPQLLPDATKIVDSIRDAFRGKSGGEGSPGIHVSLNLKGAGPVRVSVQVNPGISPTDISVQPLFSLDRSSTKPPIHGASIAAGRDGRSLEVTLSLSPTQPHGRYLGAIYDTASGNVVGGLTVEITG
ncbi:MAG: hypothetical protein IPK82_19425 [Polyangiaceae bacterium]|nr:hypothetical protein [Polyangiaceae bacterium]